VGESSGRTGGINTRIIARLYGVSLRLPVGRTTPSTYVWGGGCRGPAMGGPRGARAQTRRPRRVKYHRKPHPDKFRDIARESAEPVEMRMQMASGWACRGGPRGRSVPCTLSNRHNRYVSPDGDPPRGIILILPRVRLLTRPLLPQHRILHSCVHYNVFDAFKCVLRVLQQVLSLFRLFRRIDLVRMIERTIARNSSRLTASAYPDGTT